MQLIPTPSSDAKVEVESLELITKFQTESQKMGATRKIYRWEAAENWKTKKVKNQNARIKCKIQVEVKLKAWNQLGMVPSYKTQQNPSNIFVKQSLSMSIHCLKTVWIYIYETKTYKVIRP